MKLFVGLWFAAGIVFTTTPAATPTHGFVSHPIVAPAPSMTLPSSSPWWKVYRCEDTGSWFIVTNGPMGGLGIREGSWVQYGGLAYAPNPGEATPSEQVAVATRIEGTYVPDQNRCENW